MDIITKYGTATVVENCVLVGSSESLQWLTELHESFGGQEDRYALRDTARIFYNIDLGNGSIFNNYIRGLYALPLKWQALECVIDGDFIVMNTSQNPDLSIGYAVVNGVNVEIIGVGREVDEEYQDGFLLSSSLTETEGSIYPLRICIINGDASINAGYRHNTYVVQFDVLAEDLPTYVSETPEQYLGKDVYLNPIESRSDSLDITLMQHQTILDNSVGAFQSYTHHARAKTIVPRFYFLRSMQEQFDFKKFLYRREGRYREFWMPQPFNKGKTAPHYATRFLDGTWAVGSGTTNVDFICPFVLYRLDNDTINIGHGGNGTATATLAVVELIDES